MNLSLNYKEHLLSLVYTLSQDGIPVPAQHAVDAISVVNDTDMSRLVGYEVVTKAERESNYRCCFAVSSFHLGATLKFGDRSFEFIRT